MLCSRPHWSFYVTHSVRTCTGFQLQLLRGVILPGPHHARRRVHRSHLHEHGGRYHPPLQSQKHRTSHGWVGESLAELHQRTHMHRGWQCSHHSRRVVQPGLGVHPVPPHRHLGCWLLDDRRVQGRRRHTEELARRKVHGTVGTQC